MKLPEDTPFEPGVFALQVLSSVHYSGSSGEILVSTSRASETAIRDGRSLGEREVRLPSGETAWFSDGVPGEYPNQVVWRRVDGLIITVAGTLPADRLAGLAAGVTVSR